MNPHVPSQPALRFSELIPARRGDATLTPLGTSERLVVSSGRAALALALAAIGIQRGDKVLVPAYHCPAITGPIEVLGAAPELYRIHPDLSVNVEDVERRIGPEVRAAIIIHYFGLPRPIARLRALCDRHRIALIEDCAHSAFGHSDAGAVGTIGDFAIASLTKFLPVFDGGMLASIRHELPRPQLKTVGVAYQLKAAYRALARAHRSANGSGGRQSIRSLALLRALLPKRMAIASPVAADGGGAFDRAWQFRRPAAITKVALATTDFTALRARRLANFRELHKALSRCGVQLVDCAAVSDDCSPYAVGLLAPRGRQTAVALRARGVPVFQWDQSPTGECLTASRYGRELLQIPCHQGLTSDDVAWMVKVICEELN